MSPKESLPASAGFKALSYAKGLLIFSFGSTLEEMEPATDLENMATITVLGRPRPPSEYESKQPC
jgi:hypothetical protein